MRFKNCTLAYVKNLYMQKHKAVEESDHVKIEYLKLNYPELFDAKFMMDILRNEVDRAKKGLDNNIQFKNYLFQYQ